MEHGANEKMGMLVLLVIIGLTVYGMFWGVLIEGYDPLDWAGWLAVWLGTYLLISDILLYMPTHGHHALVYGGRLLHLLLVGAGLLTLYQ